ncbi:MAG: hypothetical protein WCD42_03405 [Rhizomicrobium sp.]
MFKPIILCAAMLSVVAMPTFAAEECGPLPVAPAFVTAGDLAKKPIEDARKDVVDSYHLVKVYQSQLNSFRNCQLRLTKGDEDAIAAAKAKPEDAGKIPALQQRVAERQVIYDKSLDSEQSIATEFNNLRLEHCKRGDTDPKVCPQQKK